MVDDDNARAQAPAHELTEDEKQPHELGSKQELRRRKSAFSTFAVSFMIISVLSGCLTLYGSGMTTGGSAIIVWGWPIVGIMTLFAGLAMAAVCSSLLTAGGLYYSPGCAGASGSGAGHRDRGHRGRAAAGDRHRCPAVCPAGRPRSLRVLPG